MKIPNANNKAFMTVLLVFAVDLTAFAFPDETRLRIPGREHDGLDPARSDSVDCVERESLVDRKADAFRPHRAMIGAARALFLPHSQSMIMNT
jgi:hypothetical protein